MIATVRTSKPGTLTYILHQNRKDPTEFIYYEAYQDQAAFDAHGKTDHMKAFGEKIGGSSRDAPRCVPDRSREEISSYASPCQESCA